MRYKVLISLLFVSLLFSDTEALGQSRRERRERERRERDREEYWRRHPDRRPQEQKPAKEERREEAPPKPKPKKKLEVEYPESVKKETYRIDVLIPLYLDELVKNDKVTFKGRVPDKALPAVEFFEGIKLAVDTLNFKNYKMDVYVHDVTNPAENVKTLISNGTLASTDLIIGAVQSGDIRDVADFAKKNQVNFISAISPYDADVRNNPYFTLIQPRLQTHCEKIMKKIAEKYHKGQITILYRTSVNSDDNAYSYLTNILEENDLRKISCNTSPDSATLAKAFSSEEINVVVMPIVDNSYAEALLKKLYKYFPDYSFAVYGMPSWKAMPGLRKPDMFPNVAVYFTAPFFFDVSTNNGQLFSTIYNSRLGGKPGEMTFRGFEILYWYATLLNDYGTIFNPYISNNDKAPFTKFDIKTEWDKKKEEVLFNENQNLYMYRYQSSSYMIER